MRIKASRNIINKSLNKESIATGMVAKKKFGQNFLVNQDIKEKILSHTQVQLNELIDQGLKNPINIIEIGPGRGDLTKFWSQLKPCNNYTCYEIDKDLDEYLKSLDVDVEYLDIMDNIFLLNNSSLLVSNLPYYIGSRLLIEIIKNDINTPFAVILQREVVDKVSKNNDVTFFGACLNLFYNTKMQLIIPNNSFVPAPKVQSAFVTGYPKNDMFEKYIVKNSLVNGVDCLKSMFFKPNKTLLNNLYYGKFGIIDGVDILISDVPIANKNEKKEEIYPNKDNLKSILLSLGLDPEVRVSWENYENIFITIYNFVNNINK